MIWWWRVFTLSPDSFTSCCYPDTPSIRCPTWNPAKNSVVQPTRAFYFLSSQFRSLRLCHLNLYPFPPNCSFSRAPLYPRISGNRAYLSVKVNILSWEVPDFKWRSLGLISWQSVSMLIPFILQWRSATLYVLSNYLFVSTDSFPGISYCIELVSVLV